MEKYHVHYIVLRVHPVNMTYHCVDVNLDHLAEVVFFRVLYCKIALFPLLYYTLWEEVTADSPHLKSGGLCSTSRKILFYEGYCDN